MGVWRGSLLDRYAVAGGQTPDQVAESPDPLFASPKVVAYTSGMDGMVTVRDVADARGLTPARVRQVLDADDVEPVRRVGPVGLYDPERVDAAFAKVRPGGLGWRGHKPHKR